VKIMFLIIVVHVCFTTLLTSIGLADAKIEFSPLFDTF